MHSSLPERLRSGQQLWLPQALFLCRWTTAGPMCNSTHHAFRRFRNTHLRNYTNCPEGVYKFWMGHAGKDMSDLYDKVKEDVAFRREVAERCGFGFQLPAVVPNVPICTEKAEVGIAA